MLQQQSFSSWSALDDANLLSKFQDALKALTQPEVAGRSKLAYRDAPSPNPFIEISQNPINNDIYVNDLNYGSYLAYQEPLKNGNVSLVNDTKLFLSVEARSLKDNSIINEYEHYSNLEDHKSWGIVGPKGWGLLGISSYKEIELEGDDAHLEIIIGSLQGDTDKPEISAALVNQVFINGVAMPALNMIISTLLDQTILGQNSYKNVVAAMNDIYGINFLKDLTAYLSNEKAGWSEASKVFIFNPVTNSFNSCFQEPVGGGCRQLANGFNRLMGYSVSESAYNHLLLMMVDAAEKRILKKSVALVPVAGWIVSAAFFIHDNIGYVSDTATIAESLYDMKNNPKEINVDVEFAFDFDEVTPLCAGISPDDDRLTFQINGEGFVAQDGSNPFAFMGTANEKTLAIDQFAKADGTQMLVHFDAQELVRNGSRFDFMFLSYDGFFSMLFPELIELIDQQDDRVIFNQITPIRAETGATVELKGCGWVPLEDVKVYFKSKTAYVEAEIISKSVDTIEATVPGNAVSGMVYVTAGNKETRKLHFYIHPFSLKSVDSEILEAGESVTLSGKALEEVDKVFFTDGSNNRLEGVITSLAYYSISVIVPDGLKPGLIAIHAERIDGRATNMLAAIKKPVSVSASPDSQSFEGSLIVSLHQPESADIFYTIDDSDEQQYNTPIVLSAAAAEFEYYSLIAYARVVVDDKEYDSSKSEYRYMPCIAGTVLDDGTCFNEQVVSVSATDATSSELGDTAEFTFTRTGDLTAELQVAFNLSGTATPSTDFTLDQYSSVTFPVGQSSVTLVLTPSEDSNETEGEETVLLTLQPGTDYVVGSEASALVTITDFVTLPTQVSIEALDNLASEKGSQTGSFTVSRSGDLTDSLRVKLSRAGSAAYYSDYSMSPSFSVASMTVTIPAGESSIDFIVTPRDDATVDEGQETVQLSILTSSLYEIFPSESATVFIEDRGQVRFFLDTVTFGKVEGISSDLCGDILTCIHEQRVASNEAYDEYWTLSETAAEYTFEAIYTPSNAVLTDYAVNFNFESPPAQLTGGLSIPLNISGEASGFITGWSISRSFTYFVRNSISSWSPSYNLDGQAYVRNSELPNYDEETGQRSGVKPVSATTDILIPDVLQQDFVIGGRFGWDPPLFIQWFYKLEE